MVSKFSVTARRDVTSHKGTGLEVKPVGLSDYKAHSSTLQSPVVTLCTAKFDTEKFYVLPTVYFCVLYGSENKEQLFTYTELTDWFV
jgi:hypothetical protein